jgi:hypothetical protein
VRTAWRIGFGLLVAAVSLVAWGQVSAGPASTRTVPHTIPFSMSQTRTRVQTLPNGTTITHIELMRTMRDSQGRMRTEREGNWGDETVAHEGSVRYLQPRGKTMQVMVSDPGQRTVMNWQQDTPSKLVTLSHIGQPRPLTTAHKSPPIVPKDGPRAVGRREDRGVKSIQGIYAKGTRSTTTFPAGFDGNSGEYSTWQETWMSVDLGGVMVEESNEGPDGKITTTLTSLQEGEPDPALFKAPEGYTIWDQRGPDSVAASQ